ncbi:MAG: hypothetical protein ACRERE_14810 [Candidatus Entotheonellia bacterium]
MNLIYPRCCVLMLEKQTVLACLRVQNADSPAHEEVRTFPILVAELATLSDWLAAHGVTHVALEATDHAWKPIYQTLQKSFTVLRIAADRVTDVKDLSRIASLLAYGLEPCRVIPPTVLQEPLPHNRRKLLTVGAMIAVALLVPYWVWEHPSLRDPAYLPVPTPSRMVRWQEPTVSYQYPATKPFTFFLPKLDRGPEGVPVDVALDASGDRPSWLQFDREQLSMHGEAPSTAKDQTYRLIVRARTAQGSDSQLLVLLTITAQAHEISPTPRLPSHWSW